MARPKLTRRIQDSRGQRRVGLFPTTGGAGLAARLDPAQRLTTMAGDVLSIQAEETGILGGVPAGLIRQTIETEAGTGRVAVSQGPKQISPEELNKRHANLGIKFDRPMTEEGAQMLADLARARLIRDSVIRREPSGLGQAGLGFGASLLNMALDPLEVASVFVPVVGASKQAAWIARHGSIAGRARVGVVEGFVGNLMMEPGYMSLSNQLKMDYGMGDALANVFLGSVLGGTLGGGLGAARLGRRRLTLTEDMRTPMRLTEEMRIDAPVNMVEALNLSRAQRERLPVGENGQTRLHLRPAEERTAPDVEARVKELNKRLSGLHARRSKAKRPDTIGRLDEEIATVRAERDQVRTQSQVNRVELVDRDGNAIELAPEQSAALVAAVNGPSPAQRGQALRSAVAQMAQGKSVRVADTAEDVSRLKNKERLARGRVTQIRNELERVRAEGDAERIADLEGRLARAEEQHQAAKAEVEGGQATIAQRVASEEQRIERSSTYDADAARRLDEAQKQDPLPEDDAVQQEVDGFVAEFEQALERGEITEENLEAIRKELKDIDGELAAGERITEFLKVCLKR